VRPQGAPRHRADEAHSLIGLVFGALRPIANSAPAMSTLLSEPWDYPITRRDMRSSSPIALRRATASAV
jgi:hypothetical protein